MYEQRARRLLRRIRGRSVGSWRVDDLIGHGKSAAVFSAHNPEHTAALKIFDPELVARYGELTQLTRIQRELTLSGHHHQHLVQIYDGGKCPDTEYYYLVMEHVNGNSLSQSLTTIQRDRIPVILRQIASAAKYLEDQRLVHRDIKPDNIVLDTDTDSATLLDLGVLRPISSESSPTDDGDHHFVGTLQYSPPEFLLRDEEDTIDGWRAVTFYQIGAILYDLIEGNPIFSESRDPYARLVNAVQSVTPIFQASDVPDLISLAQKCLVKSPHTRLQLVTWDDLLNPTSTPSPGPLAKRRLAAARGTLPDRLVPPQSWQTRWKASLKYREVADNIEMWLRQWCIDQDLVPPLELITPPSLNTNVFLYQLRFRPDATHGLRHYLVIHFELHVLDGDAPAVKLLADAVLTDSLPFPPSQTLLSVYRGIVEERPIRLAYEDVIYPILLTSTREDTNIGRIDIQPLLDSGSEK